MTPSRADMLIRSIGDSQTRFALAGVRCKLRGLAS
jgi:hypothetical protein